MQNPSGFTPSPSSADCFWMDCVLPEIYRQIPRHLLETQLLLTISSTRMGSAKHLWWEAYPSGQSMVSADGSDLTIYSLYIWGPILTILLGQHMRNISRNSTPQQPWLLSHCRVKGRVRPSLQTALSGLASLDFTKGKKKNPLYPLLSFQISCKRQAWRWGWGNKAFPSSARNDAWLLFRIVLFSFIIIPHTFLPNIFPSFPCFSLCFPPFYSFF